MIRYIKSVVLMVCLFNYGNVLADGGAVGASGGGGGGGGASMGSGESTSTSSAPEPTQSSSTSDSSSSGNSASSSSDNSASSNSASSSSASSSPDSDSSSPDSDSGSVDSDEAVASADTSAPTPDLQTISINESQSPDYKHRVVDILRDNINGRITISGNNFGSAPNIIVYDTFDNGVTGNGVPLVNPNNVACQTNTFGMDVESQPGPQIGCWDEARVGGPVYSDISHSGSHSILTMKEVSPGNSSATPLAKIFPGIQEIFISFWAHIPPGDYFPNKTWVDGTPGPAKFSKDSSWKMTWLYDADKPKSRGQETSNLCIPTHVGSGNFMIAGNDLNLDYINHGNEFWSWNNWTRMASWIRAKDGDPTGPGVFQFQAVSLDKGFWQARNDAVPIFDADGGTPKQFTKIDLPGWIRETADPDETRPLYDDVYIATGPNSVSRVELGDASTYLNSNRLAIQMPQTWSDTEIKVTINNTGFSGIPVNDAYLYITDNDGHTNANGYPLK